MSRRNRRSNLDDESDFIDENDSASERPAFQSLDPDEDLEIVDEEVSSKQESITSIQKVSKLEIATPREFRKRNPISKFGFYHYKMWLFDMERTISENKRRKSLREAILSCFSNLISKHYVPTSTYKNLMYWLDDEIEENGIVLEETTYLLDLVESEKTLNFQDPEEWDREPFKLGLKDDYESVGYTLFNYLVEATKVEGYYLPKFFHWENWYNQKCTRASGMSKIVDRWVNRNDPQPPTIDEMDEVSSSSSSSTTTELPKKPTTGKVRVGANRTSSGRLPQKLTNVA